MNVIHEKIVVLTIVTTEEPFIDDKDKQIKIRQFGSEGQFYRVKLYFGFKESPDVRYALNVAIKKGLDVQLSDVSFFVGNEHLVFKQRSQFPIWRRELFLFMFKNAGNAIDFFKIPVEKVVELGVRVEL